MRFRSRGAWLRLTQTLNGTPLPPANLLYTEAGTTNPLWFVESGRYAAESIQAVLEKNGITLAEVGTLLDFGCGCGRVLRFWKDTPLRVYGVDYNPALVAWCKQNLRFATCELNQLAPPLQFPNDQFGLVNALSVFTHHDEPLQHAWMEELKRVIRPGGFLIVSLHGTSFLQQLNPSQRERFHAGQLVIKEFGAVRSNQMGAYHPEQYVREQFAKEFEVVEFVLQGAKGNPTQDLYLLRKPAKMEP